MFCDRIIVSCAGCPLSCHFYQVSCQFYLVFCGFSRRVWLPIQGRRHEVFASGLIQGPVFAFIAVFRPHAFIFVKVAWRTVLAQEAGLKVRTYAASAAISETDNFFWKAGIKWGPVLMAWMISASEVSFCQRASVKFCAPRSQP